MNVARSVSEVLSQHTTLALECVDRMNLNVYVPLLQTAAGAAHFFRQVRGGFAPEAQARLLLLLCPLARSAHPVPVAAGQRVRGGSVQEVLNRTVRVTTMTTPTMRKTIRRSNCPFSPTQAGVQTRRAVSRRVNRATSAPMPAIAPHELGPGEGQTRELQD